MTHQEFDKIKFTAEMKALINGQIKNVVSVDFDKKLVGLEIDGDDENIDWVRCEHIQILEK